ncbi:MAG TPA: hypothetical protein VJT31_41155, partial [Rugosimonospora sp.]|nr:hypothetical protein [Rugosimonospora sp.]
LLDAVPSGAHRAALEACAQVRVTTEPLLATLLGVPDARELFDWLRGLSVMESGPRGLYPHDLVRDALGAELRWRHPDRYAEIHRRAGGYYQQQFTGADPAAQQSVLSDFAYLHRDSEVLGPFLNALSPTSADLGDLAVLPAREADLPAVRELVARYEGGEAAAILDHWLGYAPQALAVARTSAGQVAGCCLVLTLDATVDAGPDPAVRQALAHLRRHAPLRDQERASMVRFWLSTRDYQGVSPVATLITLYLVRHYLTTPDLAVSLQSYAEPEQWAEVCQYADFVRVADADFTVGGHRYGVYAHDWRAVPPLRWLGVLGARETAEQPLAVAGAQPAEVPRVLDFDEFGQAVRAALPDIGRPDRLRTSPLVRSRLVIARLRDASGPARTPTGQVVQELLREAVATVEASARDRRGYRALHHTYLQPAGSQQAAAELLDLPMSTFRRHLAAGVERVTEILWERELS